jgi:pimeloyl-ACP methyl ester carboxylesterase
MLETTLESHAGHRLRVARLGKGPPILLLHGYPDTLQIWCRLAPLLTERFEVIAFDWPGKGYSDAWPGGATPFHMADRLLALLDAWGIEKAVLAGIDMGGQPAAAFSIRHPDRVRALVLMNSLLQWDAATSWEIAVLRRFGWNRLVLRYLPAVVFYRALRTFLPRGESLDPAVRADMWESFSKREVRDFIVRLCAGYQGTLQRLAEEYFAVLAPTLLLWAERDKHFPVEHARRFQNAAPTAQIRVVPGAEHWMPLSAPEVVARQILDFVSGLQPSRERF